MLEFEIIMKGVGVKRRTCSAATKTLNKLRRMIEAIKNTEEVD